MFGLEFIRTLTALLLALTLSGLTTACGSREPETAKAAREGILLIGNGAEPKGLDPHLVTGVPESQVIQALIEGLVAYDQKNDLIPNPGMAETWDHNADFTQWTFHLRDAKWSNGDPLTAQDFVYSWHRMLSPKLGAEYAPMLYVIKNAEAFNKGEIKDFSQVGVKALDAHTLQVTLAGSTSYFPLMTKHYSFFPVNPRVVEAHGGMEDRQSGWSTAQNYVGNGPFKIKKWVTNQVIEVERNPFYWDAKTVKLNGIRFYPIENVSAEEIMFRNNRLHKTNTVTPDKIEMFRKMMPEKLVQSPYLGTYFMRLNVTRKPFNDVRVRRALALALDKKLLVDKVLKGGQGVATGFVPKGMAGYDVSQAVQFNQAEARRLLAEAGYPGGKGFPKVEIMSTTSESARKLAEALQELWRRSLGIQVGIYNQEWKVYLDNQSNLNYDMTTSGWIADYVHPSTFVDMFTTGNGNNDTGWSNRRYDALIEAARHAPNEEARNKYMHEAEDLLLAEMPIIPLYWYTRNYLSDPRVKGWYPTLLDHHPYKYVWLEPDKPETKK